MMPEESFQKFFNYLPQRTAGAVIVLHCILLNNNKYLCLDLNQESDNLNDMNNQIIDWFNSNEESTILPYSVEDLWRKYQMFGSSQGINKFSWKRYYLNVKNRKIQVMLQKENLPCPLR